VQTYKKLIIVAAQCGQLVEYRTRNTGLRV